MQLADSCRQQCLEVFILLASELVTILRVYGRPSQVLGQMVEKEYNVGPAMFVSVLERIWFAQLKASRVLEPDFAAAW